MNANGNVPRDEAIAEAEQAALEQQDAIPPSYLPPTPTPPPEPAPLSPDWFAFNIQANEMNLRQVQGNRAALREQLREIRKKEQRIIGGLEALRAMQKMSE